MARKRRKGEQGNEDDRRRKKLKSTLPQDTNIEILPAKAPIPEHNEIPAQTVSQSKKMTSKKRKRLEKYIENKLRKEEAAGIIKKLAERQVDTSALRSTKLLGQGQKKKLQQPRKETSRDSSDTEDERSINSAEDESHDSVRIESKEDAILESSAHNTNLTAFGTALKSGSSNHGPTRTKQKPQNKLSWRERLEYNRKDKGDSDANISNASTSNEDDYSDWSDFASESDHAESVHKESVDPQSSESDDGNPPPATQQLEVADRAKPLDDSGENLHQRASEFKLWAREQSGFGNTQSNISSLPIHPPGKSGSQTTASKVANDTPETPSDASMPARAPFVRVNRHSSIQESRIALPIIAEEQQIMEILSDHDCLVICGETGSGKTTQIPQFLFEAGYGSPTSDRSGMIGVTQPRRVAAVSMSSRVAEELGTEHRARVGYQIRFDAKVSGNTAIKFMTDGVLLREVAIDLLLGKYSAIIVDEAHERSVNTDVLIGVLSRVVKLRREMSKEKNSQVKPLKLIVMSATMRVTDFTENSRLFPQPPPVINVDARQFPVTTHFTKRTAWSDYVDEAFKKVTSIHQRLPAGGILIFLTGQDEIRILCNKLRELFPDKSKSSSNNRDHENPRVKCSAKDMELEIEDIDIEQPQIRHEAESDDDIDDDSGADSIDVDEISYSASSDPLHVLPLFSLLPVAEQLRVFQPTPEGTRLCVVATNVAETSLTIPGIRYVVDCGRVKERVFDKDSGVESYQIGWISKASAAQRAGRAGRTGPGHCYRLYSSAVFERDFSQFSEPEILKYPIEGIVLQMKGMHIDKVVNFPFPTPPDRGSLANAEKLLEYLGALDKEHRITPLGQSMAAFPLVPRYSKMIILGQQFGNMPYIIAIVAGLSVGDPFLSYEESQGISASHDETGDGTGAVESEVSPSIRRKFEEARDQFSSLDPGCDVLRLLCAIGAYECGGATVEFCEERFLRVKIMKEIRKLRIQISNIVNNQLSGIVAPVELTATLPPPSPLQARTIKQIVAATYLDHIAIRSDLLDPSSSNRIPKITQRVEYTPFSSLLRSSSANDKRNAIIHPNSAMASVTAAPDYVIYSDLRESQHSGRLRILPLTEVAGREIEALAKGTPLISYSKPLNYPPPRTFSENGVVKKEVYVVPRFGVQGRGWELPSIKRVENLIKS